MNEVKIGSSYYTVFISKKNSLAYIQNIWSDSQTKIKSEFDSVQLMEGPVIDPITIAGCKETFQERCICYAQWDPFTIHTFELEQTETGSLKAVKIVEHDIPRDAIVRGVEISPSHLIVDAYLITRGNVIFTSSKQRKTVFLLRYLRWNRRSVVLFQKG